MEEVIRNIAKELKLLRIANDYTLKELSRKSMVDTGTICKYEQGKSDMKISTLSQIVNSYGIDTSFFLVKSLARKQEDNEV